jgi:hypothetical protein
MTTTNSPRSIDMETQQAVVEARIEELRHTGESLRFERRATAADGRPTLATRARLILGRRLVVIGNALLEGRRPTHAVIGGR